jgi:predicted aspartyl protease
MSLVYAVTEVTNIIGGEEKYTMPFLVDTGATDTIIPANDQLDAGAGLTVFF